MSWTRMVKLPQALGFGREIESILLILSDHPEEIVRKIADKKSVGDYLLVGEKTKSLADPIELLKSKGLVPIQHRETQRQVRDVTSSPEGSPVLAELDIDSVLYDFDDQKIRLFEVEVESKSEKGQNVVKSVTRSLKGEYGHILRSWRHGKLATGTGIAKLLKSGELKPLIDAENRLLPAAYDRLNRIL